MNHELYGSKKIINSSLMTIKNLARLHSKDFDDFSLVNCLDMSNDYKRII